MKGNLRELANKRANSKDLEFFVQLNELSTGRNFVTLLSSPANRLANYLVYLGDIYRKIDRSCEWAADIEHALRKIQLTVDEISAFIKDQTARRLVVTMQVNVFDNTIDLLSPSRTVQKSGKLRIITDNLIGSGHSSEKVVLVLCNDLLLYGDKGKLSKGKCRAVMQLPGMYAEDMVDNQAVKSYTDVDIACCFRIKTRSHKPMLFQCADVAAKQSWLAAFGETIERYNSTMKRSVAPDQLQLACLSADDFERLIMKKKVDNKAMAQATVQAQSMAAQNKANPLPPSPTNSPRRGSATAQQPPPMPLSAPVAPSAPGSEDATAAPSGAAPPAPPMAPPVAPPMAPPMAPEAPPLAPSMGAPPAPPMAPKGPPPMPVPGGGAAAPPPAPKAAPAPPRVDLLSSIREGGAKAALRKVSASAPASGSGPGGAAPPLSPVSPLGGVDLNAALKSSLDRYRQFVQDDSDDEEDEWD